MIIRAQDFLNSRGLKPYEELRRGGTLIILDNLAQLKQFERKQRIVFFSQYVLGGSISSLECVASWCCRVAYSQNRVRSTRARSQPVDEFHGA